jgi:hypothetical protein
MLRIQHCLDNWLRDGGEVVSLMSQPQKFFFLFLALFSVRVE